MWSKSSNKLKLGVEGSLIALALVLIVVIADFLGLDLLGPIAPFLEKIPFVSVTSGSSRQSLSSGRIGRRMLTPSSSSEDSKSFYVSEGKTIELTYAVTVEEGSVNIYVYRTGPLFQIERVWSVSVKKSETSTVGVRAPRSSRYKVSIHPWGLKGSLDVRWKVR